MDRSWQYGGPPAFMVARADPEARRGFQPRAPGPARAEARSGAAGARGAGSKAATLVSAPRCGLTITRVLEGGITAPDPGRGVLDPGTTPASDEAVEIIAPGWGAMSPAVMR